MWFHTYMVADVSRACSWDAQMNEEIEKGKPDMGSTDVTLRDSHLNTGIKKGILMNALVLKLECAG